MKTKAKKLPSRAQVRKVALRHGRDAAYAFEVTARFNAGDKNAFDAPAPRGW